MKQDLNKTAGRENKPHIGIFGRCNSGKSTLLNFLTGTDTAIVSPEPGTTTDVVRKSYEISGFAPVVFIDTAGTDDASVLGAERVKRTHETICQIDLALLVFTEWGRHEQELIKLLDAASVPYIPVFNVSGTEGARTVLPSAVSQTGILPSGVFTADLLRAGGDVRNGLLDEVKKRLPENSYKTLSMFAGRVKEGDVVLLVCPVDSGAPAGRLILPQVQALRELLDRHAVGAAVQPGEVSGIFERGIMPSLVVTDSQVYAEVRKVVPEDIEVTSFSILLAAAKGDYELYLKGLDAVDILKDGDRILIAESCSHQVSCDDIGRVKIPVWLQEHTGKKLEFTVVPGLSPLPEDISSYALMLQCGGCMVTRSQLQNRIRKASSAGVPVTNYGMLIKKIRK